MTKHVAKYINEFPLQTFQIPKHFQNSMHRDLYPQHVRITYLKNFYCNDTASNIEINSHNSVIVCIKIVDRD